MDCSMNPGCGMSPSDLVNGDPFILKQPICNEMKHEGSFESRKGHAKFRLSDAIAIS